MASSIPHEFMTSHRGRTASKQPNSSRNHHHQQQQTSKSCQTAEEQLVDGNSTATEQIEISRSGNSSSNNASCDQLNRCDSTFTEPDNNVVDSDNCEQLSLSVGDTESKPLKLDIGKIQSGHSNSSVGNKERGHFNSSVGTKEKGNPKSSIINTEGQHLKGTINDSVSPDGHVTRAVSPAGRRGKVSQLQLENEEWNRFLRNISCDAACTQEA
jgi:hypothetical protein